MDESLQERLHRLAGAFVIPGLGPRFDEAIVLAEDLVAAGVAGTATVEVAVLRRDALGSDAEPLVRNMLAEFGIDVPIPEDEEAEYRLLLKGFGFWELPVFDFYSPFLHRLPSHAEQDGLQRTLTTLLDELDNATDPADKQAIVQRMRAAVRTSG